MLARQAAARATRQHRDVARQRAVLQVVATSEAPHRHRAEAVYRVRHQALREVAPLHRTIVHRATLRRVVRQVRHRTSARRVALRQVAQHTHDAKQGV